MPPFANISYEVAALLLIAAVVWALAAGLRQPLIVAFIAVGILTGPAGLNWVQSADQVDLLTKMGGTRSFSMSSPAGFRLPTTRTGRGTE